ncbi:hypothetical protein GDO78_014014 [Eleutherodactylus coqui]|uniref:Uncharacterized protein n=1 Tax=Eleutherodactylus coqui TaxID=57060 RepID=A0A8J6JZD0_ELECQ|nr:hypothetical protein GDO78_014014 [Eleutherodactylus coqui]
MASRTAWARETHMALVGGHGYRVMPTLQYGNIFSTREHSTCHMWKEAMYKGNIQTDERWQGCLHGTWTTSTDVNGKTSIAGTSVYTSSTAI